MSGSVVSIAADHPAFDGHFPGQPILPGVVILGEVLRVIEEDGAAIDRCSFRLAKFLSPVRPGERLEIALTRREGLVDFVVSVEDRRVCSGTVAVESGPAP